MNPLKILFQNMCGIYTPGSPLTFTTNNSMMVEDVEYELLANESEHLACESELCPAESELLANESELLACESELCPADSEQLANESELLASESEPRPAESEQLACESEPCPAESELLADESEQLACESEPCPAESEPRPDGDEKNGSGVFVEFTAEDYSKIFRLIDDSTEGKSYSPFEVDYDKDGCCLNLTGYVNREFIEHCGSHWNPTEIEERITAFGIESYSLTDADGVAVSSDFNWRRI